MLLVLVPILVAAVFAASGLLKSADGAETVSFLRRLPLPGWLKTKIFAALIPPGELILAAALLLAGGGWFFAVCVATLAVALCYLAIVLWAWRAPEEIACNCFGSFSRAPVSARTVVRNGVLVMAAVVLVVMGARGYPGLPATAERANSAARSWVPVLDPPSSLEEARARTEGMRVPPIELVSREGDIVYLDKLKKGEDRLVFFIQAGCDACAAVMPLIPIWEAGLRGRIELIAVSRSPRAEFVTAHPEIAHLTCYGGLSAAEKLSVMVSPSLVLLGHEGVVLAGPIAGPDAIATFMAGLIRAVLAPPDTHRRPAHQSYIYATSEGKT